VAELGLPAGRPPPCANLLQRDPAGPVIRSQGWPPTASAATAARQRSSCGGGGWGGMHPSAFCGVLRGRLPAGGPVLCRVDLQRFLNVEALRSPRLVCRPGGRGSAPAGGAESIGARPVCAGDRAALPWGRGSGENDRRGQAGRHLRAGARAPVLVEWSVSPPPLAALLSFLAWPAHCCAILVPAQLSAPSWRGRGGRCAVMALLYLLSLRLVRCFRSF